MPIVICERLKFKFREVRKSSHIYVTFGILSIMLCVTYTGCFPTCGHYCRRWFRRSLSSKTFI